jgi:hypothetical protein
MGGTKLHTAAISLGTLKPSDTAKIKRQSLSEYVDDFKSAYSISFAEASSKISAFPSRLIRTFNILASVRELHAWKQPAAGECHRLVEREALDIIRMALLKTDEDALRVAFERGGELEGVFDLTDQRFMTRSVLTS